jgi:hypothetical protein
MERWIILKKIFAALLALVMALSFVTTGALAEDVPDGTPGSPLQIGTAAELLAFAARVTNDDETTLCAELTDNITVSSGWTAIGAGAELTILHGSSGSSGTAKCYNGVFDGKGYTLKLTGAVTTNNIPMALFARLGVDAVVKNLDLEVNFSCPTFAAGVAAVNWGTISDVVVSGTINATREKRAAYTGGIVGLNTGEYKHVNNSTLFGLDINYGRIYNCVNKASITAASTHVGGIAGGFYGYMESCGNQGAVKTSEGNAGGLVGSYASTSTQQVANPFVAHISDCYNAGTVTDESGGVLSAGLLGGDWRTALQNWTATDYFHVKNCFNFGNNLSSGTTKYIFTPAGGATINEIFSGLKNTFWLVGSGSWLFASADNYIAADYSGDLEIKTAVLNTFKPKTADEFKTAALATALNAGRTGSDPADAETYAPWQYVPGNDYPTLKFEGGEPGSDEPGSDEPGTGESGSGELPDGAAAVSAGAVSGYRGSSVTVPVSIEYNPGFYGFSFKLTYDASALELTALTPGAVVSNRGTLTPNVNEGIATFTGSSETVDIISNGVLFDATFKIKDAASLTSYPVAVALTGGLDANFVSTDESNPPVTFTAGSVTAVDHIATGDADGDGAVTSADVLFAVRTVARLATATSAQIQAMDMDSDTYITVTDVLLIAKKAAS